LPLLNTRDESSNYNKMKNESKKIGKPKGNGVLPCVRRNFIKRYNEISKSDWFIKTYKNKSLGDIINYT